MKDSELVEYAHIRGDLSSSEGHALDDHLKSVGTLARSFLADLGAGEWGEYVGCWHDLGKYSDAFQDYLRRVTSSDSHRAEEAGRIDHSSAGAQHAVKHSGILGHLLAYVISGHHSGLLDGRSEGASLERRLHKTVASYERAPELALEVGALEPPPALRAALSRPHRDPFAVAFFTRMVFSALVDADFVDTESFLAPERSASRPSWPENVLYRMNPDGSNGFLTYHGAWWLVG